MNSNYRFLSDRISEQRNQPEGKQVKSQNSAFHSNLLKFRVPKFPPQMLLFSSVTQSNSRFLFVRFNSKYKVQRSLTTEQNPRSFTEAKKRVKYFKTTEVRLRKTAKPKTMREDFLNLPNSKANPYPFSLSASWILIENNCTAV